MSPLVRRAVMLGALVVALVVLALIPLPTGGKAADDVVICGSLKARGAAEAELQCGGNACSINRAECRRALDTVVKVCNSPRPAAETGTSAGDAADVGTKAAAEEFAECLAEASPMVIRTGVRAQTLLASLAVLLGISSADARYVTNDCTALPNLHRLPKEQAKKVARAVAECLHDRVAANMNLEEFAWVWMEPAYDAVMEGDGLGAAWGATPLHGRGALFLSAAAAAAAVASLAAAYARSTRRNPTNPAGMELSPIAMA